MRIAIAIIEAVLLPLLALMLLFSAPVCHAIADATIAQTPDNPAEHEMLVEVAMGVRDFSLGNDEAALPLGDDYRASITPDAIEHLLDVRTVFLAAEFACAILFIVCVVLILVQANRRGVKTLSRPLIVGGAVPLIAAVILGIAIAIDFNAFFTWMHGIFFADATWTFPYDSLLIRALPTPFWTMCAVVWAVSMIVLCLISIVVGIVLVRSAKKQDTPSSVSE